MALGIGGSVCATSRRKTVAAIIVSLLTLVVAEQHGLAQTGDAGLERAAADTI